MKRSMLSVFALSLTLFASGCGYNKIQGLDEEAKAALSEVDNQYQRRNDLIPNLVQTVKGYAKQEKDTLTAVVEARSKATQTKINIDSDSASFQKFQAAQEGLSQTLSKLMVVVEKYPDLKSNQNFRDLQAQLEGTENRIAVARKRYIETVAEYNKAVRFFPTNLTAKFLLGAKTRETFTVSNETRANPTVNF